MTKSYVGFSLIYISLQLYFSLSYTLVNKY